MFCIVAYSTLITHNRSHLLRSRDTWASTALTWWKNELHWLCVVSFVWRRQNTSNSYWVLVQVNLIYLMEYQKIISLQDWCFSDMMLQYSFLQYIQSIYVSTELRTVYKVSYRSALFFIPHTFFLSCCHHSMLY